MLKVRFPNGQCITYNNAHFCCTDSSTNTHNLYHKEDKKKWIASVPITCIVEAINPCKIENPIMNLTLEKAFDMVVNALEEKVTDYQLPYIKKLLKNYNSSTYTWK